MKKVKVLCNPAMYFSIGDEKLTADKLTVEQAELVAAQYPGAYVEVVDEKPTVKAVDKPKE